jgi:hypothetical protein
MNLFRFLKRAIRTTVAPPPQLAQSVQPTEVASDKPGDVPAPTPVPSQPTPDEIRRLLFDAVATGDESRLHELCKEHEHLIVEHSAAWLEVPPEFRTSPELHEWYGNGLRAISQFCAERSTQNELTDGITEVLDGPHSRAD